MANLSNINNKFIVTDGGNVLIGGTISGSSILQVTGSSTFTGDITTLANKRISIGTWDNSAFTSGNAYGFYVDSSTPMLILDETGENKTGYVGLSGGLMYVGGKVTSLTMQTGATGVNALIIDGDQKSTFTNSVTVNAGNGDQLILDNAAERFTQISLKNDGSTEGALWVDNTDNEVVLYANTGKSIEFHTNGNATPKLTISTSGTLTLTGDKTINTSNSLRLNAGGGTLFLDSGTNIILRTSGTEERIRIKANGNVGIGTTLPNAKLEVASGQAKTVTSGVEFARFGTSNDATQYATLTCEVKGGANAASRKWIFQTIEAGVANAGNIAFQPSGGNVGIGTDSPSSLLTLSGNSNNFATAPVIRFDSTSTTANVRNWAIGPADTDVGNFHIFKSATLGGDPLTGVAAKTFTINYLGNVGVGTTTPDCRLHTLEATDNSSATGLANGGLQVENINTVAGCWSQLHLKSVAFDAHLRLINDGTLKIMTDGNVNAVSISNAGNATFAGNVTLTGATALDFQVADFAQIKFRESGAITIDSDNDQAARNFAIKDGDGSNLLVIQDTGDSTFNGSVTLNHDSGDSLILTKTTTEPTIRFQGDTNKDFVLTISGETFTVTQNDGVTDILILDHDTKNATFAANLKVAASFSVGSSTRESKTQTEHTGSVDSSGKTILSTISDGMSSAAVSKITVFGHDNGTKGFYDEILVTANANKAPQVLVSEDVDSGTADSRTYTNAGDTIILTMGPSLSTYNVNVKSEAMGYPF